MCKKKKKRKVCSTQTHKFLQIIYLHLLYFAFTNIVTLVFKKVNYLTTLEEM